MSVGVVCGGDSTVKEGRGARVSSTCTDQTRPIPAPFVCTDLVHHLSDLLPCSLGGRSDAEPSWCSSSDGVLASGSTPRERLWLPTHPAAAAEDVHLVQQPVRLTLAVIVVVVPIVWMWRRLGFALESVGRVV